MVSYHITEPHPSASTHVYYGRGGAGNATRINPKDITHGPNASGPASLVKLATQPSSAVYATGRGGAGNMYREKERAMFSFDEELAHQSRLQENAAQVYHIGRGGAGNAVDEMKPRAHRVNSASSTSSAESDGNVRRSLEGAWQKVSRQFVR